MVVEPKLPHKSGGSYDPELLSPYFCGPLSAACSPKVGTCIAGIAVGISPLDASSFQTVKVTRNFDRRNLKIYCFRFGSFVSTWLKN